MVAIIFFIVLTIGFVLEIGSGAINLSTSLAQEISTPSQFPIPNPFFLIIIRLSKYTCNNKVMFVYDR